MITKNGVSKFSLSKVIKIVLMEKAGLGEKLRDFVI